MTIKSFSIDYNAVNAKNTFTNGDHLTGQITVDVSKKTKIRSITLLAKGKTTVRWTENYGKYTVVYYASEKYFKIEHNILTGNDCDICPGRHVFPFTFQIPDRNMPSTFKAQRGSIVYSLQAKLSRSIKIPKKANKMFTFISKADMSLPGLMEPQYATKNKKVVFFASGNITMNIHTERMGYQQGDALKVTADVTNSSTRTVKPIFYLYEKKSFFAQGKRRVDTQNLFKEKGESVASSTRQTVTRFIPIPEELPPTILNCQILKLEYRLKVVLDIALTRNPQIKLPIVVLPATPALLQQPPLYTLNHQMDGPAAKLLEANLLNSTHL
ncbi:arrestin domain-containing protein 3 isoform X2 [Esox lucius]|uniref:Arrestin C-terminal-like domain-containing protein n=1 Tax=Esox lucius TaxID=8010 RepID=A0A3P8YMU8_ESOLU|nr:arrestin domain-containing protein 3 isoform X2 [Esox lucius]